MRVRLLVVTWCLAAAGWAGADEQPPAPPRSPEQAADAVLGAIGAQDQAALKSLSEQDTPDPWLVADELCLRGEHAAAEAFARAAPRVDLEALPAYVEAWGRRQPELAERELLAAMRAALIAGQFERVLEGTPDLPSPLDTLVRIRLANVRGEALRADPLRSPEGAALLRAGADAALALGWLAAASRLYERALVGSHSGLSLNDKINCAEAKAALDERRGYRRGQAWSLLVIVKLHWDRAAPGDYARALVQGERGANLYLELGDKPRAALMLSGLSLTCRQLGDFAAALSWSRRGLAVAEASGDRDLLAGLLDQVGIALNAMGDPAQAIPFHERALALMEERRDTRGVAGMLINLGQAHEDMGNERDAVAYYQRGVEKARSVGALDWVANGLNSMGSIHFGLGELAKAISLMEQALDLHEAAGSRVGVSTQLGNLGLVYVSLGSDEQGLALLERALAIREAIGDRPNSANLRAAIGATLVDLGRIEEALAHLQAAYEVAREGGHQLLSGMALVHLGHLQRAQGEHLGARASYERALAHFEAQGERTSMAEAMSALGQVQVQLGQRAEGIELLKGAVQELESLRRPRELVSALTALARVHLGANENGEALQLARFARRELEDVLSGLGEEESASGRSARTSVFGIGALAALRLGETGDALAFLESGRAGALLESLGGRRALRWTDVPEELRREEAKAKAIQARARHEHGQALKQNDRKALQLAAKALDEARDGVRRVEARIQRDAKAQAGLWYPRTTTLREIQQRLAAHQALVVYGLCEDEAVALVLGPETARSVALGSAHELRSACQALYAGSGESEPQPALQVLRGLLVDPLKIESGVTHLIVSPAGPLAYVPFAALCPQVVSFTPSGTTHVLLKSLPQARGEGVLALGDPDYAGTDSGAGALYARGSALAPLLHSRAEVEAIGDTLLLGSQANEGALRAALTKRKRWRALHFACHGLVDVRRPTLSSLALTSTQEDDGFLTALEVLRMEVPSDLAVLSACSTGTGKIEEGEGIVGLVRAFMYAGAPRIICSLWDVDDEATQALMVKFYELWNPTDGSPRPGAAAALKQAQDFIRGHEKWSHPYYWAAWVLWGLPD